MTNGWSGANPSDWARETKARLTAVFRNSVQLLAQEAGRTVTNGGRVPVKTGNLARSVLVSKTVVTVGPAGKEYVAGDTALAVSSLELGDTAYLGWQAVYARRQNYGFVGEDALGRTYNQTGFGFLEATAKKWPMIVDRVVIDMRAKAGFSYRDL